jgi:anti-sigma factor RsiW
MRCPEVQGLLDAFLDSELSTESNLEIARHIEECTSCRERFKGEEKIRRRIREVLARTTERDETIFSEALAKSIAASHRRMPVPVRSVLSVAAGIAAVAALLLFLVPAREENLAERAVANHRHMIEESDGSPLSAADVARAVEELGAGLGISIRLSRVEKPGGSVLLAQHCRLGDVDVAYFLTEENGARVSLFLFPASEAGRFRDAARALHSAGDNYERTLKNHVFAAALKEEGIICAVTQTDEAGLDHLRSLLR